MRRQTILPFEIEQTDAPLMARGGMILPYEMAQALCSRLFTVDSSGATTHPV